MSRRASVKGVPRISPIDGAAQFQEAVEVATNRRHESEKECRIQYRTLLQQCASLPAELQKSCVEQATEAYKEMLAACRQRYEAELKAARVLLDINLSPNGTSPRRGRGTEE